MSSSKKEKKLLVQDHAKSQRINKDQFINRCHWMFISCSISFFLNAILSDELGLNTAQTWLSGSVAVSIGGLIGVRAIKWDEKLAAERESLYSEECKEQRLRIDRNRAITIAQASRGKTRSARLHKYLDSLEEAGGDSHRSDGPGKNLERIECAGVGRVVVGLDEHSDLTQIVTLDPTPTQHMTELPYAPLSCPLMKPKENREDDDFGVCSNCTYSTLVFNGEVKY